MVFVCVQMYYGGSAAEELSSAAGGESMRYTGSAVPPRLSCRPTHAATDCHPASYPAGALTRPTC